MFKNIFLIVILLANGLLTAQENPDENKVKMATALEDYFFLEREAIHLHLDKSTFLTNEKIWFQGYVINRKTKKAFFTTNIYVALYDETGNAVMEKLVYAYNGTFSGVIDLDPKWHSGLYYIQVYTNWMNNFSEDESSIFKINIINPQEGIKNYNKIEKESLELTLHPEGGNFINGIKNTVGIRVKDCRNNAPENLEAIIQNTKGETLKTVRLNTAGYGKFEVNPDDDFESVTVTYENKTMTKSLTDKHGIGFGLEVNNFSMDGKTILKIKTNIATLALLKDKKTYVLIHQDGKYLINDLILDKNAPEQTLALQNTDLFSGINTIRIIDSNMKEWANRNFYNAPKKESTVALIKNIRKADKIEFSGYYNTPNTNLSISVLPTDSKSTTENYSIVAGLGINPYLAEPLINANYYLLQPKRITNYELDLCLINQTQLKYSWENIKSTKPAPNFSFDIGLTLKGTISKNIKNKSDHTVKIVSFKDQIIKSTPVNDQGEYEFENLILADSTNLSMSTLKLPNFETVDGKISFQLLNRRKPFYKPFKPSSLCKEPIATEPLANLDLPQFAGKAIELEEVKIEKKLTYQRVIGNGFLTGYKVDESMENIDLLSFIERNGFIVIRQFGEATIYSRINNTFNGQRPMPQIMIDGRVLINQFEFTTMRMSDFDEIYISSNALVPGMLNRFGIIRAYTKKNFKPIHVKADPNNIFIKEAFAMYPNFNNAQFENTNNRGFDYYGVIEWKALLSTNDEGFFKLKVTDYNKPEVKAIIEGITPEGTLIHEEIILEMK